MDQHALAPRISEDRSAWKLSIYTVLNLESRHTQIFKENSNLYHKDIRLLNLPLFLALLANQGNIVSLLGSQVRRIFKTSVPEKITGNKMNEKRESVK